VSGRGSAFHPVPEGFDLGEKAGPLGVVVGSNLLDAEYRFTQGGLPQRTFKMGREISVGVSYAFY